VGKLAEIIRAQDSDRKDHMKSYEQAINFVDLKFRNYIEKIEVLSENKELLMKERMIFEERMTEFSYEN
jgi:hypothetical protein